MNPFEMVVMIVFISVIGGVASNYFKHKNGGGSFSNWDWDLDDLWDDDDDDDGYKKGPKKIARQQQQLLKQVESKYEQKVAALEERVQVLEKIVTDDKYELKKEFDKLSA